MTRHTLGGIPSGLVVGLLLGCTTMGQGGGGAGAIGPEVLERVEATTVHEVVERFRPRWLRARAHVSIHEPDAGLPVVFLDGSEYGAVEVLRQLSVRSVARIEFVSPGDATTRFGTGYPGGVILVSTNP